MTKTTRTVKIISSPQVPPTYQQVDETGGWIVVDGILHRVRYVLSDMTYSIEVAGVKLTPGSRYTANTLVKTHGKNWFIPSKIEITYKVTR